MQYLLLTSVLFQSAPLGKDGAEWTIIYLFICLFYKKGFCALSLLEQFKQLMQEKTQNSVLFRKRM
jgi:hypothetical protein